VTDNISHLPEPGLILDLDAEERSSERKPPFKIKVGDRVITFADPEDLDWRDVAAVEGPQDLVRVSLSKEDRLHITSTPMPSWKFGKLMKSYYDYYGLEEKIENARRQAQFYR
jgi:hypothetical protein